MLSREDLHEYQNRAVEFIQDKQRCLLLLDMGLGKTASTLTAMVDLLDSFQVERVLVIAPLRVASSVWKQECAKWSHLSHLRVSVCVGPEGKRMAALQRSADIYVINRENLPWLVKQYPKKWPFRCVVIDESSSFKSASSQRFKAMRKVLPETDFLVGLTGTPSPNGLLDVWAQMFLVDFGLSLGRTMGAYKDRYFEAVGYMGYSMALRPGAAAKIHDLMSHRCISMSADDYLSLPDRLDLVESVDLPPKVLDAYKDFESSLLAELPGGHEVEAISAAVLANKLLQYSNGAMYVDEAKNWTEIHTAKLDALGELIEQNDEPMLVAYNYRTDLERICKRFPDAVVLDKDPETIARWNRGDIRLLLAHPASAGHGLNLQDGGSLLVWFGLTWSLELYQQFNARLHRQGQSKPVRVVHLVAKDCIDERVLAVLSAKDACQAALLMALRPARK